MVNWTDPVKEAQIAQSFDRIVFTTFGLYVWELLETCGFEWSIITGRRKIRWPLIFFFLCRYSNLCALIGIIVGISVTSEVNCGALSRFSTIVGNLAILTASTCLMIRAIVMWERKLAIVIPLCIISLAHWGLLWRGMFITHASWSSTGSACVTVSTDAVFLQATFFFTMAFDFILFVLVCWKLLMRPKGFDIWRLLLNDGLIYFMVTFSCNIVPAVLNILNLNPIMNVVSTIPTATVSVIAACRTVMELQELHSDLSIRIPSKASHVIPPKQNLTRVRVQTEQFVMDDLGTPTNRTVTYATGRHSLSAESMEVTKVDREL